MPEPLDYRYLSRSAGFLAKMKVTITGAGAETVLLGNGFGTDQRVWTSLLPWLERRYRTVRFDWAVDPVHFDAARYARLESFAEDLLAIAAAIRATPCTLIAHSMSAMIGVLAAEREPTAFRRVVMIAAAPRYIVDDDYPGGFTAAEVDTLLERMGEDYLAWAEAFSRVVVGPDHDLALVDDFRRSVCAMRPDVALSMAQTLFQMDLRDRLAGYATPTTLVQPTADPVVPVAVGEYLARQWPQARLEIIDASGHLPHLTAPQSVIAALEGALPD
ncbi:pimeloyl-ACP methyl ester carboxylesterase [Roseiarcus fermentans]|uniref:Pimeloyl-ACP methyl ester carboxylesterase n=1 Tax=Roseiarcus fermentans TaxID=1473586 RepID=A0A366FDT7_9HYPH|nr:alpha/beta hydrolase [Roseiarcus fermentans]RBP11919.1 pimeloyl-ACP methyl ester carboxylesterase [Roseiarcus fermentans]